MDFGEKPKRRLSINITSLVDILIVLLLFFMLTSQFVRMEILHLDLTGKSQDSTSTTENTPNLTITLKGAGKFILNNNEYNLLELKDKIRPLLKDKDKSVIVRTSDKASVQDVVTAMDYIRAVGASNVSVEEDEDNAGK